MVLQVTSLTWQSTKCTQIPNIHPPNNLPATASIAVQQAWWTGVPVLGHTSPRNNPLWVDTQWSTHTQLWCPLMICTLPDRAVRRGWKGLCPSAPAALPACPWLSHPHEVEQPKVWVPGAEMLRGFSIHQAAGRGQNRAAEWFLLLCSHKTLQTQREQKGGWTEALSSSSLPAWCRAMDGEILPAHIQSYWTWIILLVTSPSASGGWDFPLWNFLSVWKAWLCRCPRAPGLANLHGQLCQCFL